MTPKEILLLREQHKQEIEEIRIELEKQMLDSISPENIKYRKYKKRDLKKQWFIL